MVDEEAPCLAVSHTLIKHVDPRFENEATFLVSYNLSLPTMTVAYCWTKLPLYEGVAMCQPQGANCQKTVRN